MIGHDDESERERKRAEWIISGIEVNDLNDWEEEFVEDIKEKIEEGRTLTEKQMLKLEEIYRKCC